MVALLACLCLFDEPPKAKGEVLRVQRTWFESTPIEGVVVDVDGKPVNGATVFSDFHGSRPSVVSGEGGAFRIVMPPKWTGYNHITASIDGGKKMSEPAPAKDYVGKKLALTLKPSKPVKVKAVDGDGKPVPMATVAVGTRYARGMPPKRLDADGTGVVWLPPGDLLHSLAVYKDGVGLDYKHFEIGMPNAVGASHWLKQPGEEPVVFKLDGARHVKLKFVDPDGKPIEGVRTRVTNFEKKNRGDDYFNPYGEDDFFATSNDKGLVEFRNLPKDLSRGLHFDIESDTHFNPGKRFDSGDDGDERVYTMPPKVELSGIVMGTDGKPAGKAVVMYQGQSPNRFDPSGVAIRADSEGRFRALVPSEHFYIIRAAKGPAASSVTAKVVNKAPLRDLKLVLLPSTRLHGKLVRPEGQTEFRKDLQLSLKAPAYDSLPLEQQTLGGRLFGVEDGFHVSIELDKDGNYETWLGPGKYLYRVDPYSRKTEAFEVNGQPELRKDFGPMVQHESLRLDGKVVLERDPTKAVAGAEVKGHMPDSLNRNSGRRHLMVNGRPVTDEQGKFFVTRDVGEGILEAKTADGKLVGTATFTDRQKTIVIRVGPSVTIKGRVVDSDGKPKAKYEVQWSRITDRLMSGGVFSGREMTNNKGEFEIRGLIPNAEYHLSGVFKRDADGNAYSWKRMAELKPALQGLHDAGDLKAP